MRLSTVLIAAGVGLGAWWLWRSRATPAPVAAATRFPAVPMPRPARPASWRTPSGGQSQPTSPMPPESDPRFQSALARYNETQQPGYIGISRSRPRWVWTSHGWAVAQAV